MHGTRLSRRAALTSPTVASCLGAVAVTAILLASGCRSGSNDSGTASGNSPERVLDAVMYSRPSQALDDAADPTLADYGDLLFNTRDLANGYVLDGEWCDQDSARCVTVGGDETVTFGDEPLEAFVVQTDPSVDSPTLEVVDVRALHHPVSNQLRLVLDVKPTEGTWSTAYETVQISTEGGVVETQLDGPDNAVAGQVSRYELGPIDKPVSSPTKLVATFSTGGSDGDTAHLTIALDDAAPDIERPEAPLEERPPVAIYRVSDSLPEDEGDEEGAEAIAKLIDAIVKGADTSDFVRADSPGASAVAALRAGELVHLRNDPEDDSSLCWQTYGRGTFCERWHGGIAKNGVLSSWSVEGTPIEDLVVTRAGSLPGTTTTMVRAPSSNVVLATTTVVNDTAADMPIALYRPAVQRGDEVVTTLSATGAYQIAAETTEEASAVIDADDFDFDLVYPNRPGSDAADLRFDADGGSANAGSTEKPSSDLQTQSARLASLLQKQRFDDAAAETAPGSSAQIYLNAMEAAMSDSPVYIDSSEEPTGSPGVCARTPAVVCTTVEVTQVDADGRITAFSVEGNDVETLLASDRTTKSGDFEATLGSVVLWPKWGVFADWSVTNSSVADVTLDSVSFVSLSGVISESERPIYDDVPAGRTITGTAYFDESSLEGAIELTGSGRDAVRELSLVVPLDDAYEILTTNKDIESTVEFEATETEFETPGGTELTVPGDWSELIWFDEETNKIGGDGTSLNRVKSIYRGDMTVLAFSPTFAPRELSSDQLIAEITTVAELSDATPTEVTTTDGQTVTLLVGKFAFFDDPKPVVVLPGTSDLIFVALDSDEPENPDEFTAATLAIAEQLGIIPDE